MDGKSPIPGGGLAGRRHRRTRAPGEPGPRVAFLSMSVRPAQPGRRGRRGLAVLAPNDFCLGDPAGRAAGIDGREVRRFRNLSVVSTPVLQKATARRDSSRSRSRATTSVAGRCSGEECPPDPAGGEGRAAARRSVPGSAPEARRPPSPNTPATRGASVSRLLPASDRPPHGRRSCLDGFAPSRRIGSGYGVRWHQSAIRDCGRGECRLSAGRCRAVGRAPPRVRLGARQGGRTCS